MSSNNEAGCVFWQLCEQGQPPSLQLPDSADIAALLSEGQPDPERLAAIAAHQVCPIAGEPDEILRCYLSLGTFARYAYGAGNSETIRAEIDSAVRREVPITCAYRGVDDSKKIGITDAVERVLDYVVEHLDDGVDKTDEKE